MRYLRLWLFCCCIISCSYFENKKVNADDIINEELKTFNWNEVDDYPMFSSCQSSTSKTERKRCFESVITDKITQKLNRPLVVSKAIRDTIMIDFEISNKGELTINQILVSDEVIQQLPKIDSLLRSSLNDVPKISPAIKRGQPVNTKFTLPVIVATN